jgi:hypothetical protein
MIAKARSFLFIPFLLTAGLVSACSIGGAAAGSTPSAESPSPAPTSTPTTATAAGWDSCLLGNWTMPTADLQAMIAALIPIPNLSVPSGELNISFDGASYDYSSGGFVLRVDLGPGKYMEANATFRNTGTYATDGGMILFESAGSESEISAWTGYDNGESMTVPGAGPEVSFAFSGANPYRCSADRLEIDTPQPTGDGQTMNFLRSI